MLLKAEAVFGISLSSAAGRDALLEQLTREVTRESLSSLKTTELTILVSPPRPAMLPSIQLAIVCSTSNPGRN